MTWLVTGSAGFIGNRLIININDHQPVFAVDKKTNGDVCNFFPNSSITHVAHLAAESGIGVCIKVPDRALHNNMASLFSVLRYARHRGAYVFFASSAAAAQPSNPYAAHKAMGEILCNAYAKTYGMRIGVLRLGNVYGPGSWDKSSVVAQMCKDALQKGVITVEGTGFQRRAFVHVDDVCSAILQEPEGLHTLAPSVQTEIREVARFLARLADVDIVHAYKRPFESAAKPYDITPHWTRKFRDLWEGLEETWEWFKAEHERRKT